MWDINSIIVEIAVISVLRRWWRSLMLNKTSTDSGKITLKKSEVRVGNIHHWESSPTQIANCGHCRVTLCPPTLDRTDDNGPLLRTIIVRTIIVNRRRLTKLRRYGQQQQQHSGDQSAIVTRTPVRCVGIYMEQTNTTFKIYQFLPGQGLSLMSERTSVTSSQRRRCDVHRGGDCGEGRLRVRESTVVVPRSGRSNAECSFLSLHAFCCPKAKTRNCYG